MMDSLANTRDLIKSCLLPELKQDLDTIPIEGDQLKIFYEYLEMHLPLVYDCIQKEPNNFVWTNGTDDVIKQEIQAFLIILLCEISSSNSIYKLTQVELIQNAERILDNISLSKDVDYVVVKYYEDKLHKDKWKKQLGAVHGFVKYLNFRFRPVCDLAQRMSQKFITFCLSVALNIRSCYMTQYKALSTSIFTIMLRQGVKDDIVSMNIHGVIYDAIFKDICILDSTDFIVQQWNCLIRCLDFYEKFDSFTWNYLDDMMEVLLRNISLSPDSATSICHLKFVNKLIVYFTINHKEFEEFFDKDLMLEENVNKCRSLANSNTSYTCYRWAKGILQMFILESHKLFQTAEVAKQMLQEIHKIYILSILPIRLPIVEPQLIIFLEKFIAVLMETVKIHKLQENVMMIATSLLETFYFHLQNSEESGKLYKFKQNIFALLKHEIFVKYTSI